MTTRIVDTVLSWVRKTVLGKMCPMCFVILTRQQVLREEGIVHMLWRELGKVADPSWSAED